MATERSILERIKAVLATIDGTGSYTFDLSGTDQVFIGALFLPHRIPSAHIYGGNLGSAQVGGTTLLTGYDRTMRVRIECWVGINSTDGAEIHLAPLDAYNDIRLVLENDRTLNSNVHDLIVSVTTVEPSDPEFPGLGLAILDVDITYRQTAGA